MRAKTIYLYCLHFSNGKLYIGISNNPVRRLGAHIGYAKRQALSPVYAAIRKHGAPQLQILCAGCKDYIAALEITAITHFQTRDKAIGYNVALGGDAGTPGPLSDEHCAKIGAAHRGKPLLEEHRIKLSAAKTGKPFSAEHCANISTAKLGKSRKQFTEQARANMSVAAKERCRRLGNANRVRYTTLEYRAKMSAVAKKRWAAKRPSGPCP